MQCDDDAGSVSPGPVSARGSPTATIKREDSNSHGLGRGNDHGAGGDLGSALETSPTRVGRAHPANSTSSGKRTVCDHCRRRRIRCDGQFPCHQCLGAALNCKRDHVPKKRGPKRGHGRVINELRAKETKATTGTESASCSDIETDFLPSAPTSAPPSPPPQPFIPWTSVTSDPRNASEPKGVFSSDAYQPITRNYLHLIPTCVDLYYEHIYPIMPLLYMPTIRSTIARRMTPSEKNLIYAMSALTAFHMAGKSLSEMGEPAWDEVGRFFLDECISVRHRYDFPNDDSLNAVISSFWLSTSFFEINQSRKSWVYLREALTFAIDMRLDNDGAYVNLTPEEGLCRRRTFWILFVTERSFAVLRNKPLTLRKTPSLPNSWHHYESPEIHAGFIKLVSSYVPLDESFVAAWNDGSDPSVSGATYMNLQQILAQPLDFLRPKRKSPSPPTPLISPVTSLDGEDEPDPTTIQKADLLITQQWLRLIVWQASFRQGLLSTTASDESFAFSFPLSIARDTAAILHSLPSRAVEVHGMGIFEKIFEIGTWCVNVMGAYDAGSSNASRPFGGAVDGVGNMDFVGGEMQLMGRSGRNTAVLDPLEFFVKTLSASPNSRTMFAEKLLVFAEQTPGGMRTNLSPALAPPTISPPDSWNGMTGIVTDMTEEENGKTGIVRSMDLSPVSLMSQDMSGNNLDMDMSGMPPLTSIENNDLINTDDLGLSIITTRSSGYSIPDGPLSAGLSTAFSDLSTTSGDEYAFGTPTAPAFDSGDIFGSSGSNSFGSGGFNTNSNQPTLVRNLSMPDMTSQWDQFVMNHQRSQGQTRSSQINADENRRPKSGMNFGSMAGGYV